MWGGGLVALMSDWRIVAVDDLSLITPDGRHLSVINEDGSVPGGRCLYEPQQQGAQGLSKKVLAFVMETGLTSRRQVLSMAVIAPQFTASGDVS